MPLKTAGSLNAVKSPSRYLNWPLLLVAVFLLATACVPSGEPDSWGAQPDVDGVGLVEREFVDACLEANDGLGSVKAKKFCGCVLDGIQSAVTWEKFRELDAFIKDQRDTVNRDMLDEHYEWFVTISDDCA